MDCWHKTLDGMNLSEEAQSIRRGIGEFLQELASVDRRCIRIDSRSNNTFDQPTTDGKTKAVDFPVESFSDLLGISANKANELETIENEIFDFQETVLPYAKKEYAERNKAFEKLWKEKDRGEYEVRNHIDNFQS
jgi:hypothetical protein